VKSSTILDINMGFVLDKKEMFKGDGTTIEFDESISEIIGSYFEQPLREPSTKEELSHLREKVYKLDIDNEEKANIINLLSRQDNATSPKEKQRLTKEINKIKEKYNL